MEKFVTRGAAMQHVRYNVLPKLGYDVLSVDLREHGRHYLIQYKERSTGEIGWIYLVYKREQFLTFSSFYPMFDCNGESLNASCMINAAKKYADIWFIYSSGEILHWYAAGLKKMCEKHIPKLIRKQKASRQYKIPDYARGEEEIWEKTYSFPISWLQKVIV